MNYYKPKELTEAVSLAESANGSGFFIAGGTDLWVNYLQKNTEPTLLIDLSEIEELKEINISKNQIEIGSFVTLDELIRNPLIAKHFPLLATAGLSIATPVIRKTATIGGNLLCENRCYYYNQSEFWKNAAGQCLKNCGEICLATGGAKGCYSKFVSDMAVALIAVEGEVEIVEKKVIHKIPIEKIYSGDGIKSKNISPDAILKKITLPVEKYTKTYYRKLRSRKSVEFTSLTVAMACDTKNNIRISIGGIAQKPLLLTGDSSTPVEEFISSANKQSKIIDNDLFPRVYRKEMMG